MRTANQLLSDYFRLLLHILLLFAHHQFSNFYICIHRRLKMNSNAIVAFLLVIIPTVFALSQSGNDAELGIKWSVASIEGGSYKVTLGADQFPDNSFIALGLSHTPSMPNSFIIQCAKVGGKTTVLSRYALEHAPPPLAEFGLKQIAARGNECVASIPAKLTHAAQPQPILIGSDSPTIHVLLSKGEMKGEQPQYHGPNRKVLSKGLHLA